jgi:hypothetical protein
MRGGAGRAAEQVEAIRRQGIPVVFADAGDSLFEGETSGAALSDEEVPEVERRAKALTEAFLRMGIAAKGVGPRDNTRGVKFRKSLGLPECASPGFRLLTLGSRSIAFASAPDAARLIKVAAQARKAGAQLVMGVLPLSLEAAQKQMSETKLTGQVDLVVASHGDVLGAEDNRLVRGDVPLVQVQSKGRSLLRVDVTFGPNSKPGQPFALLETPDDVAQEVATLDARLALMGKEINAPGLLPAKRELLSAKMDELVKRRAAKLTEPIASSDRQGLALRFVPLESSLPSDPGVQSVVERFDRDVSQLNLQWAKAHGRDCPAPTKEEPGFVGTAVCVQCHVQSGKVWEGSAHSHAYATLEKVSKQFSTACVGCHVTGYGQPGGVCRIDHVAQRQNVGCEACHGPGSAHVEKPSPQNVIAQPTQERCVRCHTTENSPHFDFSLYLPRILGPGHGRPAADASPAPRPGRN